MTDQAKKVLVVEDSDTQALSLQLQLEAEGLIAVRARSAEDALVCLRKEIPDLAIIDHHLPGMEGVDLCRLLRQNPATETMPVLMLTNDSKADLEQRGLECGADDYLTKTADPELMMARIQTLLRTKTAAPPTLDERVSFHTPIVLVIDGDLSFLTQFQSTCSQIGCDVVAATSVGEAIDHIAHNTVDCVVIGLESAPGDAGEACEKFSRIRAASRLGFAILALGGQDAKQETIKALEAGADDFVARQADLTVITARIRALMRRKTLQDQNERIQNRFRETELQVLRERSQREAAQARAQLAEDLQKTNEKLERAYRELKETQVQLIQSAKMTSLGELVAGIAHEINNPLAFSMAHLGTVASTLDKLTVEMQVTLTEKAAAYIDKAQKRSLEARTGLERVNDIVSRLRTFSRLDEGEFKDADIRECVESALAFVLHKIKGLNVEIDTGFCAENRIFCAPGILNQAFLNLLSNAADAVGDQGTIRIRTGRDNPTYWIAIADSGAGIADNIRERIFEPFFTTKEVGKGTGLGLPISYRIIDRHRGTIEVSRSDLGGAEFLVRLPLNLEETSDVA